MRGVGVGLLVVFVLLAPQAIPAAEASSVVNYIAVNGRNTVMLPPYGAGLLFVCPDVPASIVPVEAPLISALSWDPRDHTFYLSAQDVLGLSIGVLTCGYDSSDRLVYNSGMRPGASVQTHRTSGGVDLLEFWVPAFYYRVGVPPTVYSASYGQITVMPA